MNLIAKLHTNLLNLLILSLILTVFTKLRIPGLPIGLGELIIIVLGLYCIYHIFSEKLLYDILSNIFIKFWLVSLVILCIGYIYLRFYLPELPFNNAHMIHDLLAYGFVLYTLIIFIYLYNQEYSFSEIMQRYIYFTILIYSVLLVVGLQSDSIMRHGYRFFALSINPNQVGLVFTIIPFLILYYGLKESQYFRKEYLWFFFILSVIIVYKIHSEALLLAIGVSLITYIYLRCLNSKYKIIMIILTVIIFVGIPVAIYINIELFTKTNDIFQMEEVNGRLLLYLHALEAFSSSIFFGLGPGPHSWVSIQEPFKFWEAHSIYIDWLTQTGLIGICLLLYLFFYIFKQLLVKKEYLLIAAFVCLLGFSFFHMTLRHPVFWFYLFFFYTQGQKENECVE